MATHETASAETSVELAFQVYDDDLFFIFASEHAACRVTLVEMVHRSDDSLLEYFTVTDVPPNRVIEAATDDSTIDSVRLVREGESEHLFEFIVSGPCIGATLADTGALVREVSAESGVGEVVADVPSHANVRYIVETVRTRHDAELLRRRKRAGVAPKAPTAEVGKFVDQLTERQFEVLRTAQASGYFNWPRESSAEECAEALGISQPTFTQHLRAAEQKIVDALLEERQ